jgi:hypothetical protein
MGGKRGGTPRIGRCELHAHEEGGEADKGGYRGAGIGAPGARHVGEHVVVRALEGDAPLLSLRILFSSHEDKATEVCFLLPQLMVALAYWKVKPVVECFTAQSESGKP